MSTLAQQSEELRKAFKVYSDEITSAMGIGVEAASLFVEGEAKKTITSMEAVDTGLLRNSITHTVKDDKQSGIATGYIGTSVEYGPFVHFGTSRGMKPRPFLSEAVNKNKNKILSIIEKQIRKVLK